jgi:hypothetical protein
LALSVLLPRSPNLLYWLIGLTLGGAVLAWLILIGFRSLNADARLSSLDRTALSLISYLLALVFFVSIYRTRLRSLVTATAITFVAFLIALSILRTERPSLGRALLYTTVVGLILGQTTWALNYWRADALTVGVLLMLLFYVLTGLLREYLRRAIDRHVIVEFLAVAALGVWIVLRFGPR